MMQAIVKGLLMSAVPFFASGVYTAAMAADETKVEAPGGRILVVTEDGEQAAPTIVTAGGEGGHWVASGAVAGDGDGRSEGVKRGVLRVHRGGEGGARGAWLGVMINSNCDGDGVCDVKVTKVIEGSPAEEAGVRDGDFILSVDGEDVTGDLGRAVNLIAAHAPGDEVGIVVLRDGVEETLVAKLGARPESAAQYRVELEDDMLGQIEDRVITRGRMLRKGDDGKWIVTDLGDLSELEDLPDNIRMFVPQAGSRVFRMQGDGETQSINIHVTRDGETLAVTQEDGGDIVVTRTDENGNETTSVYADPEELEQGDEEAFRVYDLHGDHGSMHFFGADQGFDWTFKLDVPSGEDGKPFEWSFDAESDDGSVNQWQQQLEESLADAESSYQESLQAAKEALRHLEAEDGLPGIAKFHKIRPLFDDQTGFAMHFGKPAYTFEVRADGRIAATLRKGDTEVVQLFADEDDLADRKPELYEKFLSVMGEQ